MKIFKYSTLSLLFTTILQAVAGYSCPNVSTINARIAENGTMRFPLDEEDAHNGKEVLFLYRGPNNKIQSFYDGNSTVDKFIGAYFHPSIKEKSGSLTCTYKKKGNRYFLLAMEKEEVKRVKDGTITNDVNNNWRAFRNTGSYVCGDDEITQEDVCQFHLTPRYQ